MRNLEDKTAANEAEKKECGRTSHTEGLWVPFSWVFKNWNLAGSVLKFLRSRESNLQTKTMYYYLRHEDWSRMLEEYWNLFIYLFMKCLEYLTDDRIQETN